MIVFEPDKQQDVNEIKDEKIIEDCNLVCNDSGIDEKNSFGADKNFPRRLEIDEPEEHKEIMTVFERDIQLDIDEIRDEIIDDCNLLCLDHGINVRNWLLRDKSFF